MNNWSLFCSPSCKAIRSHVYIECFWCEKIFWDYLSRFELGRKYCSRECFASGATKVVGVLEKKSVNSNTKALNS